MSLAGILPESIGPYVSLMMAGFLVGIFGHLTRSRWLIALGIILVFLAAAAFPLALNVFSDRPEPPGPLPRPY
jgi:cyanate permease